MEQSEPPVCSHVEGTEGRLWELTAKWFIDTQVPLIIHNGFFPTWFQGFITRQDAEEILSEKELGCFLIRLSDKTIGYILSYKGSGRCRHFVINQSKSGQFVVCGDNKGHNMISGLIEYYKTNPIQPFGEYLTSPSFEEVHEELYDIIQARPALAVRNTEKQQNPVQPPTRPPRKSRTLEEAPPLPQRNRHLDSGLLKDEDKVLYAQLRKQSPSGIPRFQHTRKNNLPEDNPRRYERSTTQYQNKRRCSPPSVPRSVYSEIRPLDCKSRSLPFLDNISDGEQSYRLSSHPHTPPRFSPKPMRRILCNDPPSEKRDSYISGHNLEYINDSAVYYLAGRPGCPHTTLSETRSEQHEESVYAEVSGVVPSNRGNTYGLNEGKEDTAKPEHNSSTYEPSEDSKPKHKHTSWGLKNEKWKWLFPEVKKKW